MLLVYVDDILLFSASTALLDSAEQMLEMQFKCSKMGEAKYYLGMHVERDVEKGVLRLHQRKYCEGLAEKYGLQDGGKPATPLPSGFTVEPCADEEVVGDSDRKLFHSMVGSLNYPANHTRPDIAFATSRLASVVSRPSHEQLEAAKRKPKVDMLRVFGCMCMALVPKKLRHNKLDAKATWAVHLGMAQNSKGWLLWDPFTKKFLVSRDCKFMENLPYKERTVENQAKIGVRLGELKSTGLEHVELPLELSSSSTITRQSPQMNGGEEEEEVQQVDERAPSLPPRATSARGNRPDLPQRHESIQVPAAEEEGRGRRKTQPPKRLSYERLGGSANSTLTGSALMLGDDAEDESEECTFAFFSPVEIPGEPTNPKEAWEGPNGKEWKKASDEQMGSIIENDTFDLVNLPLGRKAISSMWIYKRTTDADGNIERYKSRLVAKGYQQQEKKDYNEVYAPVIKGTNGWQPSKDGW
ncbi:hypothetical protein CLOP_g20919 [Closterium sp. NIES-67]|nr:hypothetical protein CLOP_g20919 [Closterium sp. NIES-67]